MEKLKVNFSQDVPFHFLIIFALSISHIVDSKQVLDDQPESLICDLHLLNCGPEGTCVDSNSSILGVDCECKSGWKEAQLGDLRLPLCLPNCTFDLQCGGAPAPPPVDPPEECSLVFCNRGNCVSNGTEHECKCFPGASNLLNDPSLLCLDDCSLGADCHHLVFGGSPPPPSSNAAPPGKGSSDAPSSARRACGSSDNHAAICNMRGVDLIERNSFKVNIRQKYDVSIRFLNGL